MEISKLFKTSLVGIGQIFLQDNGWTGLLFTIGMFFSSPVLGVTCFLGSLIGTLTALALKYKEEDVLFGLYGFNGSLTFMCCTFLLGGGGFENTPIIAYVIGAVGAVIATMVMHEFVKRGKTAFTFPFVITCWVVYFALIKTGVMPQLTPALPDYVSDNTVLNAIMTPFYGYAEVNFGASVCTGVLLFLGVAVSNPVAAVYGFVAAVVAAILAFALGQDANAIVNGMFSFSPVLVACTFCGPKKSDFLYTAVGVVLAVFIYIGLGKIAVPAFTFPFILASWIMLAVKGGIEKGNPDTSKLVGALNP